MLSLPKLDIQRSEPREVEIFLKMREWLERGNESRAEGIHASDLLDVRLAYFNKLFPQPLSEKLTYFFAIGKVLHALLLQAWDTAHDEFATDGGTSEVEQILYSPDWRRDDGCPIELKSNRAMREPAQDKLQEEISSYIEQLVTYAVLDGKRQGELWILYLNMLDKSNRTFPTIRCYTITLTEQHYHMIRKEVLACRDKLVWALEHQDPSDLQICRRWKCGKDTCAHWNVCRPPGRFGLLKRDWKV